MEPFPVQVLFGIYLGLVTGIVPALVAWTLGFTFKYITGVTIPGFGVVVLSLALAGVSGGLLALNDPTIKASEQEVTVVVAILVVLMLSLYAHAKGDQMGANTPKRLSLKRFTDRTLSADVVDLVGGRGEVTVTVAGPVDDMESYPPLPAALRADIAAAELRFPSDLPLAELETRVEERLRSDFDLADVSVRLDERARATVSAAPPVGGLSKRVPAGKRAVSVSALVPTGLTRGDEVTVVTSTPAEQPTAAEGSPDDGPSEAADSTEGAAEPTISTYQGVVVSLASGESGEKKAEKPAATDGGTEVADAPTAPTATGGHGRVTVAVDRAAAKTLLGREAERLIVRSRGQHREFELIALLRRGGKRFRRFTVAEGGLLDGRSLAEADVRGEHDVVVLAVRTDGGWRIAPTGSVTPTAGDELYAVGTRDALAAFGEVLG